YDQNRVSRVGPRVEGRVVRIERDLGDLVAAGAPLAVLESAELGETEAEHARTQAELKLAQESFDREQGLFEKGISSRKEVLEAQAELERARAALGAASARHRTLDPEDSVSVDGYYTLAAPIAGTVVGRDLMLGQIVGPGDDLFTVADLRSLWLVLDLYDGDLARVREGLPVEVQAAAFPGVSFRGTLTYVGQVVDSLTRTVKARVVVENPGGRLRPGMFVTALVRGVDAASAVVVPEAAVQRLEDRTVVFVPAGAGRYAVRDVVTASEASGGMVSVLKGLAAGERVVDQGGFYLKSELLKATFGGAEP
ncbi:MAG: efflux RND transporter periplasmic adaptor subunit, partial [Gemmatimonadetes bacterium]|nr:efflux RND transporter periplasmic adaptor subunit [Gemmatimonadota bacterium]